MTGHPALIITIYTLSYVIFLQWTSNTNIMLHEHRWVARLCCEWPVAHRNCVTLLQHRLVSTHTWGTVHGLGFWTKWHYTPQEDWCCCT